MIVATQDFQTGQQLGSVWDYISPSRLNLWRRCPLAFRLRYIDGIVTSTTPSLFLGNLQLGLDLPADEVVARMLAGWDASVADEQVQFGQRQG